MTTDNDRLDILIRSWRAVLDFEPDGVETVGDVFVDLIREQLGDYEGPSRLVDDLVALNKLHVGTEERDAFINRIRSTYAPVAARIRERRALAEGVERAVAAWRRGRVS